MSAGIFALLDDVAVLARMTAAASTKSAGVVDDDQAVTPQYVHGVDPATRS
jgi:predicted DNA repair protein MutK